MVTAWHRFISSAAQVPHLNLSFYGVPVTEHNWQLRVNVVSWSKQLKNSQSLAEWKEERPAGGGGWGVHLFGALWIRRFVNVPPRWAHTGPLEHGHPPTPLFHSLEEIASSALRLDSHNIFLVVKTKISTGLLFLLSSSMTPVCPWVLRRGESFTATSEFLGMRGQSSSWWPGLQDNCDWLNTDWRNCVQADSHLFCSIKLILCVFGGINFPP